jgi:hypothetical protein
MSKKHQFKYRGKTYECIDDDRDFQIGQFKFIIKTQDWVTMENRIVNQLKWGPSLKIIDNE